MIQKTNNYQSTLDYINQVSNISFRKNFGHLKRDSQFFLDRISFFLKLLDNPEYGFKFIHVTGTAGKGSVSSMVHDMLVSSGEKVGLFTSPYTTSAIENIKVDNLYISPTDFISIVESLKLFIEKAEKSSYGRPSSFELFFAIALIYFKQQKCKWVVLEVGLGGRFDATNTIPSSIISVITTIDYDHTEILGKTLKEIATDKAGIIKEKSIFISAEQRPHLKQIFKRIADEKKTVYYFIPKQKSYIEYNRSLVHKIGEILKIEKDIVEKGISMTKMPCRFEIMQKSPLVILDGAHNRSKIKTTIDNLKQLSFKKLILIIALAETNKDTLAVLTPLIPLVDSIILTSLQAAERKSIHPNVLLKKVNQLKRKKVKVHIYLDHKEAYLKAEHESSLEDCILVSGSFFLAGELRKKWYSESWILKNRKSFKN